MSPFDYLRHCEQVGVAGTSIRVYDIPLDDANRVRAYSSSRLVQPEKCKRCMIRGMRWRRKKVSEGLSFSPPENGARQSSARTTENERKNDRKSTTKNQHEEEAIWSFQLLH